jgi:splicing factor 3B subunit 2
MSTAVDPSKVPKPTNGVKPQKDKRKKKKKKSRAEKKRAQASTLPKLEVKEEEQVEIEYVAANPLEDLDPNDPAFQEFAGVFQRFNPEQNDEELMEEDNGEGKEDEEEEKEVSKRQKKKEKRLSVAVLKTLVKRPDVVEVWDVTAADPGILVFLKSYRNTVPVPRHWSQKRRYLQGKRGIEKLPFQLPEFIAATGISKIRAAIQEKNMAKKTTNERMKPKLGKMDIDYQVLHDAFFRYQTKPKLTFHGDLYYEGKEFEITLKEKKPGQLSEDIKKALGMPEGAPPPWLINMQRYGPPPSYPNLKIPGLNAPIPEGCRYGYHPGGWGKPPVDEFGRPLYGDVFGTAPPPAPPEISQPIEKKHWGEFLQDEEEEEQDEEGEPQDNEEEEPAEDGMATPSGFETPSGMATPESIDLRKGSKKVEAAPPPPPPPSEEGTGKQLYTILQQQERSVGNALMGSTHAYVIPTEKREMKGKANAVNLIRSQASEKIDIALDASEVENLEQLNEEVLAQKYEDALAQKTNEKYQPREDVSDIIAENYKKKRKKEQKSDSKSKKYKDNKNVF